MATDPTPRAPGPTGTRVPFPQGEGRRRLLLLLAALFVCLLGLSNLTSLLLYRAVRGDLDALLGERLLSVATTAAGSISEEEFTTLADAGASSPELLSLRAELEEIARANELDDVILVDAKGATLVDLRGEASFGQRHPILDLEPELATTLVTGLPRTTPLVPVSGLPGEYLKTGIAALEGESGKLLGAVAVEGGSGFFAVMPGLRARLVLFLGVGLALALILGFLFFRILYSFVRLEDRLRQSAALLAIGQISALVAHEIKNPLAIIRSRAERVRAKIASGHDREEVLEWFEAIPKEVDRLSQILTNYLSIARPDQAGQGLCRVADVADETLALVARELAARGVDCRSVVPRDPGLEAPISARSLKQILLNLILNAAEAAEGPVEVTVGARVVPGGIELEVADNGPGMDEGVRKRALEPFFSTKATGSGLGLTLVSSLVQARGGSLEIHSIPGAGTRVRILFPRVDRGGSRGGSREEGEAHGD